MAELEKLAAETKAAAAAGPAEEGKKGEAAAEGAAPGAVAA